jgi:hypothetical protein
VSEKTNLESDSADLDNEIRRAASAKTIAWKKHGYGSPEHRQAQKTLASLLRKRDASGYDEFPKGAA